jgi:hypothetical protein
MRRVRWAAVAAVIALALGAAAALSAVIASAASSVPEWYKGGSPLGAKVKDTFKSTGGAAVLEGSGSAGTISCTAETGTGEVEGPTSVKKVKLTYTGCTKGGTKCESAGEAEGTVKTNTLEGQNIYLNTAHTIAGQQLKPSGTLFAKIKCGAEFETEVNGELIGEAAPLRSATNEDSTAGKLTFAQAAGVQKWQKVEEAGSNIFLTAFGFVESGVGGGPKLSEPDVESITFKEAIELHKS